MFELVDFEPSISNDLRSASGIVTGPLVENVPRTLLGVMDGEHSQQRRRLSTSSDLRMIDLPQTGNTVLVRRAASLVCVRTALVQRPWAMFHEHHGGATTCLGNLHAQPASR